MKAVKVFLVEDQPKILKSLQKLLRNRRELELVGQALTAEEALQALEKSSADVVLLDLGLPGMNGIEATRRIKERWPKMEVLIFTVFDEEEKVLQAIAAGASGYLLKGMDPDRIVEAIIEVHEGGSVIQPTLARSLLRHFQKQPPEASTSGQPTTTLTARETEILQLIAKGLSNSDVARALNISRATVRTHLEHIYQKLSVTNRVEAITEGIRQGIIDV